MKLFYWFSMATILAAIALMSYAGYLLFYPYKVFVLNRQPAAVLTKQVMAGQDLIYKVEYCKHGAGSGKVTRTIVGETFIPIPLVETVTKEGCGENIIHLPIPIGSSTGTYHLEVSAEFKPNALRTIVINFKTEDFQIVALASGSSTNTTNTTVIEPDILPKDTLKLPLLTIPKIINLQLK